MVPTEDLCCKSGCLCLLFSFYWKIPDCIGFDVFTSCLCCENNCRTGFPTSIFTLMGQCCCFDARCAFPCDPSKVPITIGLCGVLCVDCKRGGHDQIGNIDLLAKEPKLAFSIEERQKKVDEEKQLSEIAFPNANPFQVSILDSKGTLCFVRAASQEEIEAYYNKNNMKASEKPVEKADPI